jgi:hypothetical protein
MEKQILVNNSCSATIREHADAINKLFQLPSHQLTCPIGQTCASEAPFLKRRLPAFSNGQNITYPIPLKQTLLIG